MNAKSPAWRVGATVRVTALTLLLQLAISLPAWWPGARAFPQIPVLAAFPLDLGTWGNGALFLGLVGALLALLIWPRARKWQLSVVILAGLLVLADVNRLQPWLYLDVILLCGMAACQAREKQALLLVQMVVAGTWWWSGFMKLNPSFVTEFFPSLLQPFGLEGWGEAVPALAWGAASLECLAGLGMLWPRLRGWALGAALLVHGFALLTLGPLGHNWNMVVWPWNLGFLLLGTIAFCGRRERIAWREVRFKPVLVVGMLCLVLPAMNLVGAWDHFLSGSLYSGRLPDAIFYYDQADRPQVPHSARPLVLQMRGTSEDFIPLEFWALAEMELPGYPEVRIKKRVGACLCQQMRFPEKAGIRITRKREWASRQVVEEVSCQALVLQLGRQSHQK